MNLKGHVHCESIILIRIYVWSCTFQYFLPIGMPAKLLWTIAVYAKIIFKMTLLTDKLFFFWNNILPGGLLWEPPFKTASHSRENNAKRTNTQMKHGNTFVAIFLQGISISGKQWFACVTECFYATRKCV